jgi:hypothetical protein
MRVLGENKVIPDNEVIFYDGFLYIISISGEDRENVECECICLCAEYDEPLTLSDIATKYPNVHKVIFDDALRGYVYNYKNHRIEDNNEAWEQVGTTLGYA